VISVRGDDGARAIGTTDDDGAGRAQPATGSRRQRSPNSAALTRNGVSFATTRSATARWVLIGAGWFSLSLGAWLPSAAPDYARAGGHGRRIPFWCYRVVAGAAELGGWLRRRRAEQRRRYRQTKRFGGLEIAPYSPAVFRRRIIAEHAEDAGTKAPRPTCGLCRKTYRGGECLSVKLQRAIGSMPLVASSLLETL
jgi:hypothetical protein